MIFIMNNSAEETSMIFLINKWGNANTSECSCMFRTNNLEAWLKAIKAIKEKYNVKEDQCEWFKNKTPTDEITIFSFCTTMGKHAWLQREFLMKPEFIFKGFPEGIKYV